MQDMMNVRMHADTDLYHVLAEGLSPCDQSHELNHALSCAVLS